MSPRKPRYSKEEFSRRGRAIFEQKIAPLVQDEDPYKFVAIDIESEEYEVDEDQLSAAHRLFAKNPDAQLWFRRVGFPVAEWFGGSRPNGSARVPRRVS